MPNMSTKLIPSFLLLLILAPNAHHVLSNPNNIMDLAIPVTSLDRLPLPSNALGPETITFDRLGNGPYTGVNNGRILKWSGPSIGFVNFAVTSENWSEQLCETKDVNLEPTVCGRPFGIEFHTKTDTLYIADAYHNLRSVGIDDRVATLLASTAEDVPFRFTNAIDVDQDTGVVYFTDVSAQFQYKDLQRAILTRDKTGRLMKYDPATKQVIVLTRGLGGSGGVALSKDGSFVLVSEFITFGIQRYWLKGPKMNTLEDFYNSPGMTGNIKRNADGDFWVAVSIGNLQSAIPFGVLLDQNGQVLKVLNFATANVSLPISSVQEYNGKLYIGSVNLDYIGVTRSTTGGYSLAQSCLGPWLSTSSCGNGLFSTCA